MSFSAKTRAVWSQYPRLRWPAVFVLCFTTYSLIGFLLLPPIIKAQLVKHLPQLTKRTAQVRQVRVNPWTLSLTVRGLALNEPDGSAFASWEEFYVNFQLSSIFRRAWTFDEIHLVDPRGAVILQRNGQLNFGNMFQSTNAPAKPSTNNSVPRVFVRLLSITNGFINIEDQTRHRPFRTEYRPINLLLKNLSTQPGSGAPYSFHAENDTGKTLDWSGNISVQPLSSRGRIGVQHATLKKYEPYLDDYTTAEITDGTVNFSANYFVALSTNSFDLVVTNGLVQLTNLKITDTNANEIVLSVPDMAIGEVHLNLRERRAGADTLKIHGTELRTHLNQDGSLNLLRLLVSNPAHEPAKTNTSEPWLLNLKEFAFENGTVNFDDRSRKSPFTTRLNSIEVKLKDFSTQAGTDASYSFSLTTEAAETISGAGSAAISPPRSAGKISFSAIELRKYTPFFEPLLHAEIDSGKVDLKTSYSATLQTAAITNSVLKVTGLQLKSADQAETLASLPGFSVEGAAANTKQRAAHVARVSSSGGALLIRRETNGTLNLASLVQPPGTPAAPSTPSTNANWSATIDEVALENFSVNFEDKQPPTPASAKLDQIALNLKGISTALEKPVNASLAVRINQSGFLNANGTVVPAPALADLDLALTNIDLRAFQPYLEPCLDPSAALQLATGSLNLASHVKWESAGTNTAPTNTPHLEFTGGFSLPAFAATAHDTNLLSWTNLAVDGINFQLAPDTLHIDTVRWDGFDAYVILNTNKQLNLAQIIPSRTNTAPATPKQPSTFPITVNTVLLTNAGIHLLDQSIQPPASTDLTAFSGTITGLSSDANATAAVDLAGSLGEHSPVSITGRINPLAREPHLDLTITNHNLQLTPFTPYMEKFAGHPLNRGRLSMALHYSIQGNDLKADNHVQLDQFTLGPRVESPDATKLPVKLAVALLKDLDGKILLDLPVTGRLDDPQFRIGPIILKVIGNIIVKAAASPFKLLGAAVGAGEELSFLEFQPGSAEFADGETNKIAKLVKALASKPGLTLELDASIDPHLDRDVFARQIVQREIKSARLQELAAVNASPADIEKFAVEPVEQQRLLRAAVQASFGTNLLPAAQELRASMTNDLATASTIENRHHKWYEAALVPFQGRNSPAAAARRQAKADAALLKQNPELGNLNIDLMERLLASKVEVPSIQFTQLLKSRTEAVRDQLLKSAELNEDRISILPPKPINDTYRGEARVNLSLN